MSGTCQFVTKHKPEDLEKLTVRMKNGLGSSKYKPLEYEKLQAIVDAKRRESALIGQKVQKTRCKAKATKESSILWKHRQVWSRECPGLQKAEEKAEDELHDFIQQIKPTSLLDAAIFSLHEQRLDLEREREAFRIATVEPIHQLRSDLRLRLAGLKLQQSGTNPSDLEQVEQQINFVKKQQDEVTAKLQAEYQTIEKEIAALDLERYIMPDELMDLENVPEEVVDAECPYPELKDSLIQAFHSLAERHRTRLQTLQETLQQTDRSCGWSEDNHLRFQHTLSQYVHDIPDHRALCTDMLQRLFPNKSQQRLAEHERIWDWQRFTQAQARALSQQWQRDHQELLARAQVTLQEARNAHQEELEIHRDRRHQQDICSHLREKLQRWRAQQEEVDRLEAAIAARQQEEEEERLRRRQEREAAVRSKQKQDVRNFYFKKQRRMEEVEMRDRARLAKLRREMEEQARRDKERVQFRADVLQQRREEREAREGERRRAEEEKQNRLEALRNQVAVVAEADPARLMGDTEIWRIRHENLEEFELQKPLYTLNTYTDTQIVSDPRVRVAQALREAGLQHSRYAKEVLSDLKPPRPPRRDTNSMIQF